MKKILISVLVVAIIAIVVFASIRYYHNEKQLLILEETTSEKIDITGGSDFKVIFPKGGEKLEIGNTYVIKWNNKSTSTPTQIGLMTLGKDGTDYGFKNITLDSKIFSNDEGSFAWLVDNVNTDYVYKIAFFDSYRNMIGKSPSFFNIVDNNPNAGDQILQAKYIFKLGKDFTMVSTPEQGSNFSPIYGSSETIQKSIIAMRIWRIYNDACDRLTSQSNCELKGESMVVLSVQSPESKSTILTTKSHKTEFLLNETKIEGQYRIYDKYQIDLIGMDVLKKEITIKVTKVGIEKKPL